MRVAGVGLGAALAALAGAGRAAAAAVRHQADSQRAPRRGPRALARPPAERPPSVGLCRGGDSAGHGRGGLRSGLQAKKHSLDGVAEKRGLQTLLVVIPSGLMSEKNFNKPACKSIQNVVIR